MMKFGMIVLAMLACALAIYQFDKRSASRFGYRFFSRRNLLLVAAAVGLAVSGIALAPSLQTIGDSPASYCLVGASGGVFWWILVRNFTSTNLLYGVFGSLVQIITMTTLVYAGFFAGMIAIVFMIMPLAVIQPVYVMNQKG